MKSDRLARTLFVAAVLFLVFLVGFASSQFKFFPHRFLSKAMNQGAALFQERADAQAMHPPRHDFTGVRAYDERGPVAAESIIAKPGQYVLLSSYWPECEWRPGLRLIDETGKIVHTWDTKEAMGIWPGRSSLLDRFASFTYIHGSHLFENGDVLMNIEYLGLVRMNAAGKVVWKLDRQTHHSIHRADDGNFWVCEARIVDSAEEASRRFQGLLAPLVEDRVIEVTPGGEVKSEISILELLYHSEYRNRLLSYPVGTTRNWDILHLNDVEPLPAPMAAEYPGFAGGDLLVSMRDISTVLVFDRATKKIKWSIEGRTLRQHDPDFISGGWISVFDNNSDETPGGEKLGGSRILAFHTGTGEQREIYPQAPEVGIVDADRARPRAAVLCAPRREGPAPPGRPLADHRRDRGARVRDRFRGQNGLGMGPRAARPEGLRLGGPRRHALRSRPGDRPEVAAPMTFDPITPCLAYVGPGGALSAIGSFLALVGAILLALIGFVWYPFKRFRRRRREQRQGGGAPPGPGNTGV